MDQTFQRIKEINLLNTFGKMIPRVFRSDQQFWKKDFMCSKTKLRTPCLLLLRILKYYKYYILTTGTKGSIIPKSEGVPDVRD